MKLKNPMFIVADLERSVAFYREILGLEVTLDFGANVTLAGGLCLQTQESWQAFTGRSAQDIRYGGNDAEVYFEEEDFDAFAARLAALPGVRYVHPVQEHRWGQRAVRLYDPDGHIVEVGETMEAVCRRFMDRGLSQEETALRMDVPLDYVRELCGG